MTKFKPILVPCGLTNHKAVRVNAREVFCLSCRQNFVLLAEKGDPFALRRGFRKNLDLDEMAPPLPPSNQEGSLISGSWNVGSSFRESMDVDNPSTR